MHCATLYNVPVPLYHRADLAGIQTSPLCTIECELSRISILVFCSIAICWPMMGAEQAMFAEGCQAEWDRETIPDGPLSVGLDGGIVRACRGTSTKGCPGYLGRPCVKQALFDSHNRQAYPLSQPACQLNTPRRRIFLAFPMIHSLLSKEKQFSVVHILLHSLPRLSPLTQHWAWQSDLGTHISSNPPYGHSGFPALAATLPYMDKASQTGQTCHQFSRACYELADKMGYGSETTQSIPQRCE